MKTFAAAAAFAASLAVPAWAVEVTGGTIELGYSTLFDDTSDPRVFLRGQMEIGFSRNFALQLDAGSYNFSSTEDTGNNVVLHGVLHASDNASFGLFLGLDNVNSADAYLYGLEGGFELGETVTSELYVSLLDDNGSNGVLMGLQFDNEFSDKISARAGVDYVSYNDIDFDLTKISLGAEYKFVDQAVVYAEVGSQNSDILGFSDNEAYFGLGLKVNLGARRGATFGYRSVFNVLAGG